MPRTVLWMYRRSKLRCDICYVGLARRYVPNYLTCDSCLKSGRSTLVVKHNNGNVFSDISGIIKYECGTDVWRAHYLLHMGQQLNNVFQGSISATAEDVEYVLGSDAADMYHYFVRKLFYDTFDFDGVRYPPTWIHWNIKKFMQFNVHPQDLLSFARDLDIRLAVIYQNLTSKLTYASYHASDATVRRIIAEAPREFMDIIHSNVSIATASAYLIQCMLPVLNTVMYCRIISADSLAACKQCKILFGRACSDDVIRCQHCCFLYVRQPCLCHCRTQVPRPNVAN